MRKFIALFCAVLLTVSLSACGGKTKTADPAALADEMLEALAVQGEVIEAAGSVAENYYAIGDEVKDYRIYLSTMYIAEEVAVFQLKDTKNAETVKKMCEARIQDLKDSLEDYVPEQYQAVRDNAVVLAEGDIVAMVTGTAEGVAAAKAVFEKTVK